MKFYVIDRFARTSVPTRECATLEVDRWNDFGFVTMFQLKLFGADGECYDLGSTKIGFLGQRDQTPTYEALPSEFSSVEADFFSLGQSLEFYEEAGNLPDEMGRRALEALRDVVAVPEALSAVEHEQVFGTSLLRDTSLSVVKGQYTRVFNGLAKLTNFEFRFFRPEGRKLGEVELDYQVRAGSVPSTNIHALIGRNGVGKTAILNDMIKAIVGQPQTDAQFIDVVLGQRIPRDYFSGLVSVSFSAFDPFAPPQDQADPAKGPCYAYVGLKDREKENHHQSIHQLREECAAALIRCFRQSDKSKSWEKAIEILSSDDNFREMNLGRLHKIYEVTKGEEGVSHQVDSRRFLAAYLHKIERFLTLMSSGHAIVLLTITRLVASVEEKTLVLLDEPESHLHPPLLSAFVRALSSLLHSRNGVALVATHSPVVLQEIPKECVWKVYRHGKDTKASRPRIETFAENVGILTSEVFGLEVDRSGFHSLLSDAVDKGQDYDSILSLYEGKIGLEGRALLRSLIASRERGGN